MRRKNRTQRTNIFQYADFDSKFGAYQRIRKTISMRLDPSNFFTIAFGSRDISAEHVKVIDAHASSKFVHLLSYGIRPFAYILHLPFSAGLTRPNITIFNIFQTIYREAVFSDVDIFHSVNWNICLPVLRMLKRKNRRITHILTIHLFPLDAINVSYTRKLAQSADVITGVSKYVKKNVERFCSVTCEVINDGVDTSFFKPKKHENNRLKILFIGSLQKRKRPHYVALLAKEFPECDFIIHGKGKMLSFLEDIKEKKSLKNLRLDTSSLSPEGIRELYSMADVFMFPSIHEGLPNAVLEAMASGLPILASNATSHSELVTHGVNGFLCRSLEQFKEYLRYLIEDENLRKKLAVKSRENALSFDWNVIIPQWEKLYRRALSA